MVESLKLPGTHIYFKHMNETFLERKGFDHFLDTKTLASSVGGKSINKLGNVCRGVKLCHPKMYLWQKVKFMGEALKAGQEVTSEKAIYIK